MPQELPHGKTTLGAIIRECAIEEGGMRALADRLGVASFTVRALILGQGEPTAATFAAVAAYLEMPLDTVWAWHSVRECCR